MRVKQLIVELLSFPMDADVTVVNINDPRDEYDNPAVVRQTMTVDRNSETDEPMIYFSGPVVKRQSDDGDDGDES